MLILCSRGDEAHGWLRAWDLISHAPFVVTGVLLSTLGIAARVLLQSRFEGAWPIVLVAVAVMAAMVAIRCRAVARLRSRMGSAAPARRDPRGSQAE